MKLNTKKITYILLIFLVVLPALFAFQSTDPPMPNEPSRGPSPPGLPIDGGVFLLLISGLMFGIKNKIKKK